MSRFNRWIINVFIGMLACGLMACQEPPPKFNSTDVTGASFGKSFTVTDTTGAVITNKTFADKGQLTVLYFGFSRCPDVCPTTLLQVKAVKAALAKEGLDKSVQLVFVSLDPERDEANYLTRFVQQFDPTNRAVRLPTVADTKQFADQFHVFFQKASTSDPKQYNIDHTSALFVYDRAGRLRLYVPHSITTPQIVEDFKTLLR